MKFKAQLREKEIIEADKIIDYENDNTKQKKVILPKNSEGLVDSDDEVVGRNDGKKRKEPAFVDPFF